MLGNHFFSQFFVKTSEKTMSKIDDELKDMILTKEVAHTGQIMRAFKASKCRVHMKIFCIYLYHFEGIDAINEEFFYYDVNEIITNFSKYIKVVRLTGAYRMNILIDVKEFFKYAKHKFSSNSISPKNKEDNNNSIKLNNKNEDNNNKKVDENAIERINNKDLNNMFDGK